MSPLRTFVLIVAVVLGSLQVANAQTPPSAPATPPPEEAAPATPPAAGKAPVAGKRAACLDDAKAKRLKGMERADSMQLCMAEARVACVKEAIAKKMPMAERKGFFKTCMEE